MHLLLFLYLRTLSYTGMCPQWSGPAAPHFGTICSWTGAVRGLSTWLVYYDLCKYMGVWQLATKHWLYSVDHKQCILIHVWHFLFLPIMMYTVGIKRKHISIYLYTSTYTFKVSSSQKYSFHSFGIFLYLSKKSFGGSISSHNRVWVVNYVTLVPQDENVITDLVKLICLGKKILLVMITWESNCCFQSCTYISSLKYTLCSGYRKCKRCNKAWVHTDIMTSIIQVVDFPKVSLETSLIFTLWHLGQAPRLFFCLLTDWLTC